MLSLLFFNRAKALSLKMLGLLLLLSILSGCAKGGSLSQHETREPTDYIVYFAESYGPYQLTHYLLPEHEEVQAITKLVHLFAQVDQTQHWTNLDWSPLRPHVPPWYDLTRLNKAQNYVNNKLETRFEDVEIECIDFVMRTGHPDNPGMPAGIFEATVIEEVTVSHVQTNSEWQAVYLAEFRLTKYDNIWKVNSAKYTLATS